MLRIYLLIFTMFAAGCDQVIGRLNFRESERVQERKVLDSKASGNERETNVKERSSELDIHQSNRDEVHSRGDSFKNHSTIVRQGGLSNRPESTEQTVNAEANFELGKDKVKDIDKDTGVSRNEYKYSKDRVHQGNVSLDY